MPPRVPLILPSAGNWQDLTARALQAGRDSGLVGPSLYGPSYKVSNWSRPRYEEALMRARLSPSVPFMSTGAQPGQRLNLLATHFRPPDLLSSPPLGPFGYTVSPPRPQRSTMMRLRDRWEREALAKEGNLIGSVHGPALIQRREDLRDPASSYWTPGGVSPTIQSRWQIEKLLDSADRPHRPNFEYALAARSGLLPSLSAVRGGEVRPGLPALERDFEEQEAWEEAREVERRRWDPRLKEMKRRWEEIDAENAAAGGSLPQRPVDGADLAAEWREHLDREAEADDRTRYEKGLRLIESQHR